MSAGFDPRNLNPEVDPDAQVERIETRHGGFAVVYGSDQPHLSPGEAANVAEDLLGEYFGATGRPSHLSERDNETD